MADKRVSDLPRATELGDNDLLVVEQAGEAKALPGAKIKSHPTLVLVRRLLGKAVYTEDVTADLAALDALLGGGDTGGDDAGGGGSDEPVVTAETLTFAREVDRYPNITTFAYTLTETGGWPLVLPSTIGGGTLTVTFDENRFANFQGIFYLFDKDGAPYKLGIGTGPNNSNGRPTVSGASTIEWSEPGKAPGWTGISASFTCEIPEGCNVMIAFQPTGGTSADGTVTDNNFTNEIVDNGFIQAKITKEG